MADGLEAQFQPVNDPLDPAVIEMVNKSMRAYEYAPASEPKLTRLYLAIRMVWDRCPYLVIVMVSDRALYLTNTMV
jgi:hypothetical protein